MTAPPDDRFAAQLRGFGPIGLLAILVVMAGNLLVVPLSAVLVLAWARRSATPWPDLGLVLPRRWLLSALLGVVGGVALKLLMKAVVLPLLGAPPLNPFYQFLAGNPAAIPGMLWSILIGAAIGEEILFRGYLFERLRRALGTARAAQVGIVLLTAVVFGAAHIPEQGVYGAAQGFIVGVAFGGAYAGTGTLWPVVWAHGAFDLVAYALIYFRLEAAVAHLVFP